MNINSILLSRTSVVALNIIQCALFAFAFIALPTGGSERPFVSYLVPFIPPATTLIFILGKNSGTALAAVAVIINLVAMLLGFFLLYAISDALTPLLVLATGISGMLIPAISMLAVATRWPRAKQTSQGAV